MKELVNNLKGDRVIWSFVALLALFSFMPVFSASSNLAYLGHGTGNTISYLLKHLSHIIIGFFIIYGVHKVPYHYYKGISKIGLPIVWLLLAYTLIKGTVIAGANASRLIQVPFIGITFQTSTLAFIVLMMYVARYLSKKREVEDTFQESLVQLWLPVFITMGMILPANFSTAAMMFSMVLMLTFVGKYPLKYIGFILGAGFAALAMFVLLSKAFPDSHFFSRVDTWSSRIENFTSNKPGEDDYQIEKAKIAIASGGIYGLGPGKSVQKHFLPQSSSDFIYAIIVEEWGLIGGLGVLVMYLLLFFRFKRNFCANTTKHCINSFFAVGFILCWVFWHGICNLICNSSVYFFKANRKPVFVVANEDYSRLFFSFYKCAEVLALVLQIWPTIQDFPTSVLLVG
jgi:cell division protein FtsW